MEFIKKLKDGEYMTRICAVANNDKLVVASDSLFTNSITKEKTADHLKIAYSKNMVVSLLGAIEIFTSTGNISIRSYIQDYLEHTEHQGLSLLNHLMTYIKKLYQIYKITIPTHYIFIYRDNGNFYMWYCTIYYSHETFGENRIVIDYPLNPIQSGNKDKYEFKKYMLVAGDGLPVNPIIERIDDCNEILNTRAYTVVKQAVLDEKIPTVGGLIYSIELDINGNMKTYVEDRIQKW